MFSRLRNTLTAEKDNSALIVFRIAFGFLMIAESFGAILLGWVNETFVDVRHTFTFFGFEWTDVLLGPTMTWYYLIMGILGFGIMLGYRYVLSMTLFALMWALCYFMQKSHYNNHYYLLMLVSFWLAIMPAHRYASLDVKYGRVSESLSCPSWALLFFKIQFTIVYMYAAIAKIYPDWLAAKPIAIWLRSKRDYPIVGGLFEYDWFPYIIAYGGIFYDALIIPFLFFKRTRVAAIILSLIFHLFNSAVFQVGVFPYFALAVAIFFFDVDKIRTFFLRKKHKFEIKPQGTVGENSWITPLFIVYFIVQLALPLRHHFIPGNVLWDEAGHRLSWRMMLRSKYGHCTYRVYTADNKERLIYPSQFLARHQVHDAASKPDMLFRSIAYLKEHLAEQNITPTAIYCDCKLSVNGRPSSTFVDPEFNMLEAEWSYFGKQDWIAVEPDLSTIYRD